MITWGELKTQVIDLGFEEDAVVNTDNYGRIILNSCNLALRRIYYAFVPLFEERLTSVPTMELITSDTEDTDEVTVPEEFEAVLPLVAAYFVWLDDDIQKATMYWNNADAMISELSNALNRPKECKYVGGW